MQHQIYKLTMSAIPIFEIVPNGKFETSGIK